MKSVLNNDVLVCISSNEFDKKIELINLAAAAEKLELALVDVEWALNESGICETDIYQVMSFCGTVANSRW